VTGFLFSLAQKCQRFTLPAIIRGKVTDKVTGSAIAGAKVTFKHPTILATLYTKKRTAPGNSN
jgi:hypothetical protein